MTYTINRKSTATRHHPDRRPRADNMAVRVALDGGNLGGRRSLQIDGTGQYAALCGGVFTVSGSRRRAGGSGRWRTRSGFATP